MTETQQTWPAAKGGVVAYLQRANLPLLRLNHPDVPLTDAELERRPVSWRWAFYGLGAMVLLSPLGLLAPGGGGRLCDGRFYGGESVGNFGHGIHNLGRYVIAFDFDIRKSYFGAVVCFLFVLGFCGLLGFGVFGFV